MKLIQYLRQNYKRNTCILLVWSIQNNSESILIVKFSFWYISSLYLVLIVELILLWSSTMHLLWKTEYVIWRTNLSYEMYGHISKWNDVKHRSYIFRKRFSFFVIKSFNVQVNPFEIFLPFAVVKSIKWQLLREHVHNGLILNIYLLKLFENYQLLEKYRFATWYKFESPLHAGLKSVIICRVSF